jgi:hypothetical protein
MFPETEAWFAARLRYTRSSAVMSMVGYVLGFVPVNQIIFVLALTLMDANCNLSDWVIDTERTCPLKKALVVFCMLISIACSTRYVSDPFSIIDVTH